MALRKLHRWAALIILGYACVHVLNHIVGLAGIQAHIAFMEAFRKVYRFPVIEGLLFLAIMLQIYSGVTFVVSGWKKRRGLVPWLQAISGAYLAVFFVNHVGAVLYGRTVLQLDTNFYFAAAGFHVPPFQYFFAPYYFLAVWALFTHVGCIFYWKFSDKSRSARVLAVLLTSSFGVVVSVLIVMALAGVFYPVDIPLEYKETYGVPTD